MQIHFLACILSISSALAWRVDRRCLEEGRLAVGDEVESLAFGNEYDEGDQEDHWDGEDFDWDDLEAFGFEEEDATNLRGSSGSLLQNHSVSFSNITRNLQSGRTFNLKLTWKRGACWQDEWIERKWCMECRRSCNSGDVLEIQTCNRKWTQRFQWKDGKLKVASKNMCLTKSNGLRLRPCGGSNQNFRGFQSSGGFELKPAGSSQCLSQHHHPKAGEIIELTNCALAASHKTNMWNVYWASGGSNNDDDDDNDKDNDDEDDGNDNDGGGSGPALTKRGGDCSSNDKCGKCEGDCDTDDDCKSGLKCRQRFGSTALDPVPGCSGTGKKGIDYCY